MKIKIIILFIGGFIVLSLFGLGLLGYYAEKQEIVQPETSKKPEIKVSSFIGKILEIKENMIKIQVSTAQNQGIEQDNAIITIKTAENTKYLEREIPKKIPQGKSPADLFKQKEIAFSDLKVNDEIIASASQNIAWQKEFMAQYVLKMKIVEVK